MANHRDLLLISVDSPVMLGIYENKKLVKSFEREGKFSDSLPNLFSEIFAEYFCGEINLLDSTNHAHFSSLRGDSSPKQSTGFVSVTKQLSFDSWIASSALLPSNDDSVDCFGDESPRNDDIFLDSSPTAQNDNLSESAKFTLDSIRINNIYYANGPGNFSAIKLTHIFLQTLSITKNIPLFCADAFHFSNSEFINAYGKVHFYKKDGAIHTTTLDSKRPNSFFLPNVLDLSIFNAECAPLYILPAV